MANDGTIGLDDRIQAFVQTVGPDAIGQLLGNYGVLDANEGVIQQGIPDALLGKLARQFLMAVVVELQTERSPRGHAQITQAQLRQDEVKIVMQAFARGRLQRLERCSVETGTVRPPGPSCPA